MRWFEVKQQSKQEITPVEFACETMNNVGKELWDLIVQYRSDPKRNINPFSMRLQGIIDANVMGGISKYQEAFFTEQFLKSPQGQGQQANVQKLKALILEQIQVLEQALELHGQLAPSGVQPLHNRLLERFSQLKQSLSGMGRLKRQHSESIVNTPLPPLPTEKRTMSLGSGNSVPAAASNYYEHDEIYTRPGDTLRPVESSLHSYQTLSKESLSIPELSSAPPVPHRPKSQNFSASMDGPEVPPKRPQQPGSPNAPPLPPRGITPDKRCSNPLSFYEFSNGSSESGSASLPRVNRNAHMQQNQQQSAGKYSVVDISFDDPEADQQPGSNHQQHQHLNVTYAPNDFRDSGISTTSSHELNQLNNLSEESSVNTPTTPTNSFSTVHQRLGSSNGSLVEAAGSNMNQRDLSVSSFDVEDLPMPPPPPIPPKSLNILNVSCGGGVGGISASTQDENSHNHSNHHNHASNGYAEGYISPQCISIDSTTLANTISNTNITSNNETQTLQQQKQNNNPKQDGNTF